VTYPGRSVRDGSEREPSVVIGELLDELGSEARAQIVTAHPLQPFSPSYFDASHDALFSYSSEDCAGAQALLDARAVASPRPRLYVPAGLSSSEIDEPGTRTVELARLGRFFEHPVRAFLQARLGLYLRDEVSQLEDREPMELDALARWTLGDRLLTHALVGTGPERAKALMRAQGLLPLGSAGDLDAEAAQRDAAELAVAVRELQRGEPLPPIEVDLSLAGWRIVGELGDLWPAGRVSSHFSKLPHASELSFWIQHLVLGCVARDRAPTTSFLVARERTSKRPVVLELSPLGQARERLADLLALYSLGGSVPLPLLPKASRAQADFGHQHGWAPNPVSQAIAAWEDDRGTPAERNDPYLRQAFRDVELLQPDLALPGGEGFASLAQRVYQPYLLARTQRK
jgi:exodeoxyribonuclease V gamma subunit